ncbi:MAG: class I mannose-6-phosphate isomerase [Clostridia bacterium]|nr:class I mannose-6-phosphate isomerase [Clostridia bacterium]
MLSDIPGLQVFETSEAKKPAEVLAREHEAHITNDRVFGKMTYQTIDCCFDEQKLSAMREAIAGCSTAAAVVGVGAGLFMDTADEYFFFDVTRWEIQLRYRRGEGTWMLENKTAPQLTKYKVGFFIEWRLADKHKKAVFDRVDYWVDANLPDEPHWLCADVFRDALAQTVRQPFHMQAYFDASVWGGQWMKNEFDLDPDAQNYGWAFDGVPEENALKFDFGGTHAMFPAMTLIQQQPQLLLGEHVYGRFGAEFPIRFDFLDTMEGGNLSLQVHPLTGYIQQQFGMHYTQDESYYILDAEEDSCVYLGLKNGVDKAEMYAALKEANAGGTPFDAEKYVNKIPVKKHDHVLIPAGTVHCSGRNTTVLEISATPYIFTFKMWDWGRVGLDGIPRPVHLDHAFENIQFNRDTNWVRANLIHQEQTLRT